MAHETNFADIEQARQIVTERYPDARRIEFIEHGYDNVVALVDTTVAVRFPRNHAAYVRSLYGRAILAKLDGFHTVVIPRILEQHENPAYLVTSYVPGKHVSVDDMHQFSQTDLMLFGETVSRFAYELHTAMSAEDEIKFRESAQFGEQFEESWGDFFTRVVSDGSFANRDQRRLAATYYEKWRQFESSGKPQAVIHDDLHNDNMLFVQSRLVGVVDFASASIGTAEQELRQLYCINDTVLDAAIHTYEQLAGRQLDREGIEVWAIIREMGVYNRRLTAGDVHHPDFMRACEYLDRWLPEGGWTRMARRF